MGTAVKENKEKLAALYASIANHIAHDLPQGWTHLIVGYLMDEKGEHTYLVFYSMDDRATWRDLVDEAFSGSELMEGLFDAQDDCAELYAMCAKVGDAFTGFTLQVDAQGAFQADYDYESFDEMSALRLNLWKGRFL